MKTMKLVAAFMAAVMVTVGFAPAMTAEASSVTYTRDTNSEAGIGQSSGNTLTVQVLNSNGEITKVVSVKYSTNGDIEFNTYAADGRTLKSCYKTSTSGNRTTISSSTPVNATQSLTSSVVGSSYPSGNGLVISIYSTNNVLLEKHYTYDNGYKIETYADGKDITNTYSAFVSVSNGVGRVVYTSEYPAGGNSDVAWDSSTTSSSSSSSDSSTSTSSSKSSLSKLRKSTNLEKKAYKSLKKLDKIAKAAGYTTRTYTRKSSSSSKVVTTVKYSGKSKSNGKVWVIKFTHVQKASKQVFKQGSTTFSRSTAVDWIKNPSKY